MMTAQDVLVIIGALVNADIPVWLDGGWGVDALLGSQSRDHDDVDVVMALDHADAACSALAASGFSMATDERPTRFVLCAPDDRCIDVHTVRFDAEGVGWQALPDGSAFGYPAEGFA